MQIGIHALQRNELVPDNMAPGQLAAHISGFKHAQLVTSLIKNGYNLIELGGDLALFLPHTFTPSAINELVQLKQEHALRYTFHLPLWSVEPSSPLPHIRQGSIRTTIDSIQTSKVLDPEVYVFHATGALAAEFYRMQMPELARTFLLRQFQGNAMDSLRQILEQTGIQSRKLAIETIEFPFEFTLEIAESLDLSICIDTGHVLAGFSGPILLDQVIDQSKNRLAEIHLHDCPWCKPGQKPGYGKDHRALGEGDLDIGRFFDKLEEIGFNGPVIFELSVDESQRSLELIRQFRPELVLCQG